MSICGEGRTIWARHDYDPELQDRRGMFQVKSVKELRQLNDAHYGIFQSVNQIDGPRKKENVKRVLAYAVDLDEGTKEEQAKRINQFIEPSFVIETARGYHPYWEVRDGTIENFDKIMQERILPNLRGDRKAADLARVLRMPFTMHWKDPSKPHEVRIAHATDIVYSEQDLIAAFPIHESVLEGQRQKEAMKRAVDLRSTGLSASDADDLFDRIWNIDCEAALMRISGTEAMGYETVDFKRGSPGNLNIYTNGKSTHCFINADKRVIASDGAGLWKWINWYQRDNRKTYQLIKKYFPEVFK